MCVCVLFSACGLRGGRGRCALANGREGNGGTRAEGGPVPFFPKTRVRQCEVSHASMKGITARKRPVLPDTRLRHGHVVEMDTDTDMVKADRSCRWKEAPKEG